MAVPIFMIISGYVNFFSYRRNHIETIGNAYLFKNVFSKIMRYTIPFLIAYIIEVTSNLFLGMYEGMGIIDTILLIVRGFMTGGFGPGSYYYSAMIQFVFVYPVIYFIVKKNGYKGVVICSYVQMGHHGNGGLSEKFYKMTEQKAAFFDAPDWLMHPQEPENKWTTPKIES